MNFGGAITRALKEERYDDAEKLKLLRAEPGYEISGAISDEVRPRLANLQILLTTRHEELATAEDIDSCKICGQFMEMIKKILNGSKL